VKNPSDVAKKWAQRLGAAGDQIRQGVLAVTTNPAERAIARTDAYVAGVQRAVANGTYQRGLRRVTLQSWQDNTITKGLPRIASGATQAIPKVQSFMEKFLPYVDGLKAKLSTMPRGDLEQNIARANEAMRYMAAFKMQ
jgi:hypothetical protein